MIIDFHTHIFPDRIAKKTINYLSEKGGIPPFSDGSVDGLLGQMNEAGVSVAITLPVLTNPQQFESVHRFAAEVNKAFSSSEKKLISFAGIHPKCEDIDKKMEWISNNGFLGVKIHPDYQETFITDEGYIKIAECAKEYGLIIVTHSGVDCGFKASPVRCTPELALDFIRKVSYKKIIFAHCGANEMEDRVLDTICGEDVYLDTAYVLRFISKEMFIKILEKHGEDKILFASDSPWSSIKNDTDIIRSFGLNKTTEEKIFYKNAKDLLGI